MVFSSLLFLTLFLPIVLTIYFILPWKLKNLWLLVTSLFFYFWGEIQYGWIMLMSIGLNYIFGLWINQAKEKQSAKKVVAIAVVANLALLIFFKYAHFFFQNLTFLGLKSIKFDAIALPIGISFFTFHALSYVIDVYRHESYVQKNPINFGLYIAFFPQLIAGPIIRYHDIDAQLEKRQITRDNLAYGIERFIIGLSKKVLIANVLAGPADKIFGLSVGNLSTSLAWFGLICYALQIYFDFSGYSDMAIGLARMFGFKFLENFNYPYISRSITEFWHRWHISLSNWFRDYLYIPLGGNRKGKLRTYFNLITVFFLCGLWHGASWNFIIWGLFYGLVLVLERVGILKSFIEKSKVISHFYTLFIILMAWVFFRTETLEDSFHFFQALFGLQLELNQAILELADLCQPLVAISLGVGLLGSTPLVANLFQTNFIEKNETNFKTRFSQFLWICRPLVFLSLMIVCVMRLTAGTFNPFIYFRF